MIHDKTMPLIKKIHYLKEYLKNEEARIINSIPLSTDDYELTWELIFKYYDNPQRRFESYFFKTKPLIETSVKNINILMDIIKAIQTLV
jgi:hypothetical protein